MTTKPFNLFPVFLTIISLCTQSALLEEIPSQSCSSEEFACLDGSGCIAKANMCSGYAFCPDRSNNIPSQCNNCTADHLFLCKKDGVDICRNVDFQCDGSSYCDDGSDEQFCVNSQNCSSDQFACLDGSKCIAKTLVCNGEGGCADNSHTSADQCKNGVQ